LSGVADLQPGDLIFFKGVTLGPDGKLHDHGGIVAGVDDGLVYFLNSEETGGVRMSVFNPVNGTWGGMPLRGFGRPDSTGSPLFDPGDGPADEGPGDSSSADQPNTNPPSGASYAVPVSFANGDPAAPASPNLDVAGSTLINGGYSSFDGGQTWQQTTDSGLTPFLAQLPTDRFESGPGAGCLGAVAALVAILAALLSTPAPAASGPVAAPAPVAAPTQSPFPSQPAPVTQTPAPAPPPQPTQAGPQPKPTGPDLDGSWRAEHQLLREQAPLSEYQDLLRKDRQLYIQHGLDPDHDAYFPPGAGK